MSSNTSDWTAQRVRDTFLDYFKKNGHTFGESHFFLFYNPSTPRYELTFICT